MLLGFNLLLWSAHISEEHFPVFSKLKATGYDGIELPIFEGTPESYERVGRVARDNGLRVNAVAVIPDEQHNCMSPDPKVRAAALDHMKWAIDCLAAANGEVLCGPFYQPLGVFSGEGPTPQELDCIVEVHKQASKYAAGQNIKISVEPLNRFECYALNTASAAADIVRRVQEPNYGFLYDTFHANIEEKDPVGAITPNFAEINHVHLSENDRGTPGKGHVPWDATLRALKENGYDGWFVIEAFGRALPAVAAATRVWRDFAPSREEVYEFGHDFLRERWANA